MLKETCQHPLVKTAFKSVKPFLKLAINKRTEKQNF